MGVLNNRKNRIAPLRHNEVIITKMQSLFAKNNFEDITNQQYERLDGIELLECTKKVISAQAKKLKGIKKVGRVDSIVLAKEVLAFKGQGSEVQSTISPESKLSHQDIIHIFRLIMYM